MILLNSGSRRTCDHLFVADADADDADIVGGDDGVVVAAVVAAVATFVVVEILTDSTSSC